MKNLKINLLILHAVLLFSSCENFLNVPPPKDKIAPQQVFESDDIATSAVTGIYSKLARSGFASGDLSSVTVLTGLSSDELKSHNSSLDEFYKSEIAPASTPIQNIWISAYSSIYAANTILEGLEKSNNISTHLQKQLKGEATFVRAFCYFYLVNLFGEVPMHLVTDYKITEVAPKSTAKQLYAQIISDLKESEALLPDTYITTERIRPNKWVAKAMLARAYLFLQNWEMSEKMATDVIARTDLYNLVSDLNKVFQKNSTEAIFQLMPPAGGNTREGNVFILTATPVNISMPAEFLTAFDAGDNRRTKWISEYSNASGKYNYPFKYKVKSSTTITEYSIVIRLAEMFLIRAECYARQNKPQLALDDINFIRKRAGLITPITGLSGEECLFEIEKQRKLELFAEWGHRWFDLKRTGRAGTILSPIKGATWKSTDELYPIPQNEVSRNRNITQNLGY